MEDKKFKLKKTQDEQGGQLQNDTRQTRLAVYADDNALTYIPSQFDGRPELIHQTFQRQQHTIKNQKMELVQLRDSLRATNQVLQNLQQRGVKLPKAFEHTDGFLPVEEVVKFKELMKLGRVLDVDGLAELLAMYEILEEGVQGCYIFKGISRHQVQAVMDQRDDLNQKYIEVKTSHKRLLLEADQSQKDLSKAKSRIRELEQCVISKGNQIREILSLEKMYKQINGAPTVEVHFDWRKPISKKIPNKDARCIAC